MSGTSINFQGINVEISSFQGLKFKFQDSTLILDMDYFHGKIVLSPGTLKNPVPTLQDKLSAPVAPLRQDNPGPSKVISTTTKPGILTPPHNSQSALGALSAKNSTAPPKEKELLSSSRKASAKSTPSKEMPHVSKLQTSLPKENELRKDLNASTAGGRKASKNSQQNTQKPAEKRKYDLISASEDVLKTIKKADKIKATDKIIKSPKVYSPQKVKKDAVSQNCEVDKKADKKSSTKQLLKQEVEPSKTKTKSKESLNVPSKKPKETEEKSQSKKNNEEKMKVSDKISKKENSREEANLENALGSPKKSNPTHKSNSGTPNTKDESKEIKQKKKQATKDKGEESPNQNRKKIQPQPVLPPQQKLPSNSGNAYPSRRNPDPVVPAINQAAIPAARTCQLPCGEIAPPGRWAHTLTAISPNKLVLYGGEPDDDYESIDSFGDLYIYDLETSTWTKPVNADGRPRQWHTATFLPDKNLLVVFGGETVVEGGKPETLNDIMVLDTDICLWYPPSIAGKTPEPRAGHSASLVGKHLVIFGGSTGRKWMNSVACMDTERWTWENKVTIAGQPPSARSYHTATAVGNKVVVFGGSSFTKTFDDVIVLNMAEENYWEWFHPEIVGAVKPHKRTGHCAVLLGDNKTILIYGGWDPMSSGSERDVVYFKDSFLLDTELWEWNPGPDISSGSAVCTQKDMSAMDDEALRYRTGQSALLSSSDGNSSDIILFGGQCQNGNRYADLRLVSLDL